MSKYKLSVDQILRYPREFSPNVPVIDNVRNFWHLTHAEGFSRPQLEKGINPTATIKTATGSRRPVILISSSPNRVGSAQTPWHDILTSTTDIFATLEMQKPRGRTRPKHRVTRLCSRRMRPIPPLSRPNAHGRRQSCFSAAPPSMA